MRVREEEANPARGQTRAALAALDALLRAARAQAQAIGEAAVREFGSAGANLIVLETGPVIEAVARLEEGELHDLFTEVSRTEQELAGPSLIASKWARAG